MIACVCIWMTIPFAAAQQDAQKKNVRQSPNEALRSAQTIFIRSKSVYFKPEGLENSLLQRQEFQDWGLTITRAEADADLIIEVGRKVFTTSFIFSVIDPRNNRVVASGRVNSIGGTVEAKISDSLIKRLRLARAELALRK
jgi:hypothetical protein